MPSGKYFNANEEDGISLMMMSLFYTCWPLRSNHYLRHKLDVVVEIRRSHIRWCPKISQYKQTGKEVLNGILTKPDYIRHIKANTLRAADALMAYARQLRRISPSGLSDAQLAHAVGRYHELALTMVGYGMLPTAMEISNDLLTNFLKGIITRKLRNFAKPYSSAEYFQFLTDQTETSPASAEKRQRLALAIKIGKRKNISKLLQQQIERHLHRYNWIDFGYQGPMRSAGFINRELRALARRADAAEELARLRRQTGAILKHRRIAERELRLTREEKRHFAAARDCISIKNYRKEALIFALAALEKYLEEIASRARVTVQQVRNCLPDEIPSLLAGKISAAKLEERDRMLFTFWEKNHAVVKTGKDAHRLIHKFIVNENVSASPVVKGTTGCPGYARGRVKIINVPAEMEKMKEGDVLVSILTIPSLLPAMKKAAAIVTDIGGITSHAAIVSRELRKPCLIGTRVATKTFKDGDLIEVDASHGWVKKLNR